VQKKRKPNQGLNYNYTEMKIRLLGILITVAALVGACSKDEDTPYVPVVYPYASGAFIANEGTFGQDNASYPSIVMPATAWNRTSSAEPMDARWANSFSRSTCRQARHTWC